MPQLALFESYRLPLLTFAAGAVTCNKQQVHDLSVCWNTRPMYRGLYSILIVGKASRVLLMA